MTTQEAIETLKLMQGQIEWDYLMEYAAAVDMAVVALQKQISQKPVPDGYGSQCPVTVKDVKEALKTVLYAFSNRSDIPNSSDLVSRSYLLTEYDRQHQGPPGGVQERSLKRLHPYRQAFHRRNSSQAVNSCLKSVKNALDLTNMKLSVLTCMCGDHY